MRKSAVAIAALGLLTAFTAVAPVTAQARDWDHRGWRGEDWREHHDNHGAAIALGVIGLLGAAIASTHAYAPPAYYYGPYAGYGYYR